MKRRSRVRLGVHLDALSRSSLCERAWQVVLPNYPAATGALRRIVRRGRLERPLPQLASSMRVRRLSIRSLPTA